MGSIGRYAVGDAEVFGVEPAHFPQPVVRAPEGAKAFCAFAQIVLLVADADRDHFRVAPTGSAFARGPGDGFDDQFHGFVAAGFVRVVAIAHADEPFAVALRIFLGARLSGAAGEPDLHGWITGQNRCR